MPANIRKMLNFSVMLLAISAAGCGATTTVNQPPPQASSCSSLSLGQGASLGGFVPFPADSLWNADISSAPVDPNSAAVINFIGAGISMNAASAAVWDLLSNEQRPYTWTSADAAGLPIFPGLARYDEVAAGKISHALRFTLQQSRAAFIPPASHWAANSSNSNAAPMGMRMRLKAGFDVSGYSAANQVILNALKKYGMIMADNGSNMFLSGAPDDRWDNNDLHVLGQVQASDFEVLQMTPLYTQNTLPTGASPQISSFAASSTSVSAGTPVTLSWQVNGASYIIVSPQVGAVRSTSVVVTPAQTTTYTLYATNAFGRTMSTITITVQ